MRTRIPMSLGLAFLFSASTSWGATYADALRALHEKVLEAHRRSDIEALLEDESADYVVASRGRSPGPH